MILRDTGGSETRAAQYVCANVFRYNDALLATTHQKWKTQVLRPEETTRAHHEAIHANRRNPAILNASFLSQEDRVQEAPEPLEDTMEVDSDGDADATNDTVVLVRDSDDADDTDGGTEGLTDESVESEEDQPLPSRPPRQRSSTSHALLMSWSWALCCGRFWFVFHRIFRNVFRTMMSVKTIVVIRVHREFYFDVPAPGEPKAEQDTQAPGGQRMAGGDPGPESSAEHVSRSQPHVKETLALKPEVG